MSCYQHESLWSSLTTHPYCPSLPGGLPGYILYPYRAVIDKFLVVIQRLHVQVKRSIGEHHMSSSLLLQQCPTCLVCLICTVLEMEGRYSCCFVGCCLQDLFNIAPSIPVQLPSSFFSIRLVSIRVVYPYNSIDSSAVWKKLCFILLVRSDSI